MEDGVSGRGPIGESFSCICVVCVVAFAIWNVDWQKKECIPLEIGKLFRIVFLDTLLLWFKSQVSKASTDC